MRKQRSASAEFVVCIRNAGYPSSLELFKIYRALPDAAATREGDIRVVDESGEDYLYPASYFTPIKVPHAVEKSMVHATSGAHVTDVVG